MIFILPTYLFQKATLSIKIQQNKFLKIISLLILEHIYTNQFTDINERYKI